MNTLPQTYDSLLGGSDAADAAATESGPYDCHYCAKPMAWPTIFHCKEHIACILCAWRVISRYYHTYAPQHPDPDFKYTLEELEVEYKLKAVKCPECNKKRCIDDITLDKLIVLPDAVASLYPGAETWGCPFCGISITHRRHVMTCVERSFTCTRKGCGQRVRVVDKSNHALECMSYVCPHKTCNHHKDAVPLTAHDYVKHQKHHKCNAKKPKHKVEEEEEEEEEDRSSEDVDSDYIDELIGSESELEEGFEE